MQLHKTSIETLFTLHLNDDESISLLGLIHLTMKRSIKSQRIQRFKEMLVEANMHLFSEKQQQTNPKNIISLLLRWISESFNETFCQ